jgi:hypothetical protein
MSAGSLSPAVFRCAAAVRTIIAEVSPRNLASQRMRVHRLAQAAIAEGLGGAGAALHQVAGDRTLDVDAFRIAIGEIALDLVEHVA